MKFLFLFAFVFFLSLIACNNKGKQQSHNNQTLTLHDFLTQEDEYIKIPMNQLKSGHLSLLTKVNNVMGRFILDTGSSSTIISRKHRKKFRLITKETKKIAKTAGGTQLKMQISYDNIIEFSTLKLRNVKISLVNLNHINYSFQTMGMLEVDGIIGSDLLENRKAIIDYANLVLYLKK